MRIRPLKISASMDSSVSVPDVSTPELPRYPFLDILLLRIWHWFCTSMIRRSTCICLEDWAMSRPWISSGIIQAATTNSSMGTLMLGVCL